jgi:hypothetical protein
VDRPAGAAIMCGAIWFSTSPWPPRPPCLTCPPSRTRRVQQLGCGRWPAGWVDAGSVLWRFLHPVAEAAPRCCQAAPPDGSTLAGALRPSAAGCHQSRVASTPLVVFLRQAGDAAALAPTLSGRRLDLPAPARPTSAGRGRATVDHPPGQGEPSLGLPADQGRTAAPRRLDLSYHDPCDAPVGAAAGGRRGGGLVGRSRCPARCGCGGCMCCSSSSWGPGGSTWPA